ncbi:hypothetical protein IFR05_007002, partial [Cadophora sp. M221]
MCTTLSTACQYCAHTHLLITLCDRHKSKQDSLGAGHGYNHRKCDDLKESEREVDAFDRGHECPA